MIQLTRIRRRHSRESLSELLLSGNELYDEGGFHNEWSRTRDNQRRGRQNRSFALELDGLQSTSLSYNAPIVARIPALSDEQKLRHVERTIAFPNLHGGQGQSTNNPIQILSNPCLSHGGLCCQCVRTQEIGLSENFGKFEMQLGPGLHVMCWPCSSIVSRVSLRIQQMDVSCESKTKDHVFVHVDVTVQYRIIPEMAYYVFYRLSDPDLQIRSYVFDAVRAQVPSMMFDQVFSSRQQIANAVRNRLCLVMQDYGFQIICTLCTKIHPLQPSVIHAMNDMEVSRRQKEAMFHRGIANKLNRVKQAEASVETAYLHGIGVARQRQSIVAGMKDVAMEHADADFSHVMNILLVTQYMDLLTNVGAASLILCTSPPNVEGYE